MGPLRGKPQRLVRIPPKIFLERRIAMRVEGQGVYFPISIGEIKVGVLKGRVLITSQEIMGVVRIAEEIWGRAIQPHFPDFTGLVRFDFVPRIKEGTLQVYGLYEINAQAPECIGALCALERAVPGSVDPRGFRRFVEAVSSLGGHKIFFLVGSGKVKTSWAPAVIQVLSRFGLYLRRIGDDEIDSLPLHSVLWRWGAVATPGAEFSDHTWWALKEATSHGVRVFNSVPEIYDWWPGYKGFLIKLKYVGRSFRLTWYNIPLLLLGKGQWVLKPLSNKESGGGVVFGRLTPLSDWIKILIHQAARGVYGAFEAKWLPLVSIAGEEFAMDFNSAFWVCDGKITYLYSLVRFTPWERYQKFPIINVARGGFMVPVWEE
jgi:hypothetical protein